MWVQVTALSLILSLILSYLLIGITLVEALLISFDIGNFSTNSEYGKNRDLILASLPSNVSTKGGFLTTSIGQNSNKVYTLAMCRGDSSPYACYECIYCSIHNLVTSCPNQKEALSYARSLCHVHYSDRSFYGTLELEPVRQALIMTTSRRT
ncbi:hypothetical protein GOBAR_AA03632 [Gossypium barbadense]|uniref:Gnk2-homologous domain-containing protein n=1 Tax=Gossypium barbadense TaxID=3634 RepID=A0A2P5YMY5_GOSBA|nr:hypothetical protein GOBAR_AA03632 [Gossypium barbadense]